jgi:hypothetical protein
MSNLIVCFDFDGTLVDDRGEIHPSDAEMLVAERQYPVTFIPTTGRPLHAVRRAFERNEIFVDRPIPLPLVLQNGAALYCSNEALLAHHPFAQDVQPRLVDAMLENPKISFLLFSLAKVHVMWPSEAAREMGRRFDVDTCRFTSDSPEQRFTKAVCISETPAPLQAFETQIRELPLELSYSLPTVLEVNQANIDKARGLRLLLDTLQLGDAEIIAAGDGENDLPLFDLARLSFAPETSPAAIRACVDHVIEVRETGLLAPILEKTERILNP